MSNEYKEWLKEQTFESLANDNLRIKLELKIAKEENEKLKSSLSTIDKLFAWTIEENTSIQDYFSILKLEIENSLFKNEALIKQTNSLNIMLSDTLSENKSLTQQNKQMREAINKALHFECEICPYYNTEKCGSGEIKICDEAMEFILEQALGGE